MSPTDDPDKPEKRRRDREDDRAMPEFRMRDGCVLYADDLGAGRPILFAHGWAMASGLFRPLATALAADFRVVSPDLRGHGRSVMAGAVGIEDIGRDLAELADMLSLDDIVVVGWSMGAMALWSACADAAFMGRVSGIVVLDMSPRLSNDAEWRAGLADGRDLAATLAAADAMRRDWPGAVARFVPRIVAEGPEEDREDLLAALGEVALAQDGAVMAALWESMARQDFRAALPRLAAPTLAIRGERSRLYAPEASRFIARQSPGGRALGFARSGHAPHLEEPRRFLDSLAAFAAATSKNRTTAARAGAAR